MILEGEAVQMDVTELCQKFSGKTVMVTGATGLIGKALVKALLSVGEVSVSGEDLMAEVTAMPEKKTAEQLAVSRQSAKNMQIETPVKVVAVVRSIDKARKLFGDLSRHAEAEGKLVYRVGDIRTVELSDVQADYIVHAASDTSSKSFVERPVETLDVILGGTRHMLDYAASCKTLKKFLFLSTMEVYGTPATDEKITEQHGTNLDTMKVRTCYPEGKRLAEMLCTSFGKEYGVPVNVLRLTQTFGEGVSYEDGRVFAEFVRCAIEKRDIVLKTKGETKRSYLYVGDAVSAILRVLTDGVVGEAYNAANEETYCSIYEMAAMVAERFGDGKVRVRIEEDEKNDRGFAPTLHMNLDTSKLQALGWRAEVDLPEMYQRMMEDMKRAQSKSRGQVTLKFYKLGKGYCI